MAMYPSQSRSRAALFATALILCVSVAGCRHTNCAFDLGDAEMPNEATRVPQNPYTIGPPDVLLINAGSLVPLPPYRIGALDALSIQASFGPKKMPLLENEPLAGIYAVSPDGRVELSTSYGSVTVVGLTIDEARKAVESHLAVRFKGPLNVSVDLAQSNQALQQIRGEHLVRPDGTVGLGVYGSVFVDGMTIEQAKGAIEAHLSRSLVNPKIAVDVGGFNSKVFYVVTDGAGNGQQVYRLPITGKETVLDAIAHVNGLTPVSSKHHIWLARPNLNPDECAHKLPVDWDGITQCGRTGTNYQLAPGDRVYVLGAPLITADTYLARFLAPAERIFGFTLLGNTTVRSFRVNNSGGFGFFP
jgi:polysaccharide biosynthesis/export protein